MSWRAHLFNIVFYLNLIVFLLLCIPFMLVPRHITIKTYVAWGRATRFLHKQIVGTDVEVRGLERLPAGPVLIASKHQSAWDTSILPSLFADPAMVLKRELSWIPLFGWFILKFQMIPIDRSAGPRALRALRKAAERAVRQGRQVVIFPEGTRRPPGAAPDYKPGVALLYGQLNVPCVPVALNSGLFWPRRKAQRYPGTIIVELLDPIPPGLPRKQFMRELEGRIESASARLIEETAMSPNPPPTVAAAKRLIDNHSA